MTIDTSSTAIDGYVFVDSIRVTGRYRRDLGDVPSLAESISDVGLLNPITITDDSRLVAGERRLAACRSLGWDNVPVRIVRNLTEASMLLRAERDENTCRKDMLPSEKAALGAALEEIESIEARQRMARGGQASAPGRPSERSSLQGGPFERDRNGETAGIVGEAIGMSRSSYSELKFAHRAANDPEASEPERDLARRALADMDLGAGIQPTVAKLRQDLKTPPAPEPAKFDRTKGASGRRCDLIRELADQGNTSRQIGERLGILDVTIRRLARENGIAIPADQVTARTRHIDPNRVVRETVQALEGLAMGVGLVIDDLAGLDLTEVDAWACSLTHSIRTINRLTKEIKKMKEQDQ